jgi:putative two-component system response regulator
MRNLVRAAILMLGEAGHLNDGESGFHIWRMAEYAAALARAASWPIDQLEILTLAAPLHDTGNIGIPRTILNAPQKLTEADWAVIKTHPGIGFNILSKSNNPVFSMAAEVALGHHEKWDGTGYPRGIQGKDIPESARIVAIADVFDVLTSKRPYKDAWPVERAFKTIQENSGTHFDPDLVAVFGEISGEILKIKKNWEDI